MPFLTLSDELQGFSSRILLMMIVAVLVSVIAAETIIDLRTILRLGLIYLESSALELLSIQLPDRQGAFRHVLHLDKSKPTGFARDCVFDNFDRLNFTKFREKCSQFCLTRLAAEISYINIHSLLIV